MLTGERQHAYKSNKSTINVIYNIKRNRIKKQCGGQVLLDLSKAFDRVDRKKLWNILYQKRFTRKANKTNKKTTHREYATQ